MPYCMDRHLSHVILMSVVAVQHTACWVSGRLKLAVCLFGFHKPGCSPDSCSAMQMVLQEPDAEAVGSEPEHDLMLGQAARDVDSLCQSIYETFPGLEQRVPGFQKDSLGPCRLKPAELLELHVRVSPSCLHL